VWYSDFNSTPPSNQLIREAYRTGKIVAAVAQKDPDTENPGFGDLHTIGTCGQIVKLLEMPDGSTTAIIQGKKRIALESLVSEDPYLIARVKVVQEEKPDPSSRELFETIVGS
jgi:ATP-dependent Lon protease